MKSSRGISSMWRGQSMREGKKSILKAPEMIGEIAAVVGARIVVEVVAVVEAVTDGEHQAEVEATVAKAAIAKIVSDIGLARLLAIFKR
jgi:hypothetical protein